jgi:hypothetical protein
MTLPQYLASPKGVVYKYLFEKVGLDFPQTLASATKSAVSIAPDTVNFDDYTSGFFIVFATEIPIGDRIQFIDSMTKTHSLADMRGLFTALPKPHQQALIATEAKLLKAVNLALEQDPPNLAPIDAFVKSTNAIPAQGRLASVFATEGLQGPADETQLGLKTQAIIGASVLLSLVLLYKATRD